MAFKPRIKKDEVKILQILNARMTLPEEEKRYYLNQEKGFEGEVMFDLLTEKLPEERLILNDLLLEVNRTKFQIDTTMIVQEKIHLFEVKNFEGDYEYSPENFTTWNGKEISNPLDQLKRSESLFSQLLQSLGFRIPIESYVIFINPEFTLFQSSKNLPFVYPTQLNRFMRNLSLKSSKLNSRHKKLAEQLASLHQIESPYQRLLPYEYGNLQKRLLCVLCMSPMFFLHKHELVCSQCGHHENLESAVIRSAEEIRLLFPDRKITTIDVYEWCGSVVSKKIIRGILDDNYRIMGHNRWVYYETRK